MPKQNIKKIVLFCCLIFAVLTGVLLFYSRASAASSGDIVINELMYNPLSDNQDEEYLELYNTTGSTISLNGWCFTNGITLCFNSGHSIPSHGYAVISPNASQTFTKYSITTLATYTGKLDNGGERLTLVDAGSTVIDNFIYDDAAPWPISPDGAGKSLELKNFAADNTLAAEWGASLANNGTPGLVNSLYGLNPPQLSLTTKPALSQAASATPLVRVSAASAVTVELKYKVQFGSEQTLTMYDDGAHQDGASGDGSYGASIPAQTAGKLIRYRVLATNPSGTTSAPSNDDTQTYNSYIIDDGTTSDLPIVRWYTSDADFTDLTTNHLTDDVSVPAVVAVGSQIFDNAKVRIKGGSSPQFAKKKFKFELPDGYYIDQPGFDHKMDEFALQVYFLNLGEIQEGVALKATEHFGFSPQFSRFVRLHKNGTGASDFYGHYLFVETYDKTWRKNNDFESGALYKEGFDKKTRLDEGDEDRDDFLDKLTTLTGDALKNYIYDNVDIANVVNFNAMMANTRNDDWNLFHNQYQYRDTEGTGRWEYLPWDLDGSFAPTNIPALQYPRDPVMDLLPDPSLSYFDLTQYRYIEKAMAQFPEFTDMYYRRAASIFDENQAGSLFKTWYDELMQLSYVTLQDDQDVWGTLRQNQLDTNIGGNYSIFPNYGLSVPYNQLFTDGTPEDFQLIFNAQEDYFANQVEGLRDQGDFPGEQSSTAKVLVGYATRSADVQPSEQYVELNNSTTEAIDLSGWQLQPLGFTFPAGSVIPANSKAYVVANDTQFRTTYGGGRLILGEFANPIVNSTTFVSLLRSNATVSDAYSLASAAFVEPARSGTTAKARLTQLTASEVESGDTATPSASPDTTQEGCAFTSSCPVSGKDTTAGGKSSRAGIINYIWYALTAIIVLGGAWLFFLKRRRRRDQ